jgi:hypothetical protein
MGYSEEVRWELKLPKVCSRLRFQNFRALLLVQALSLRVCFIESLPPFLVADQDSDYNKNTENS